MLGHAANCVNALPAFTPVFPIIQALWPIAKCAILVGTGWYLVAQLAASKCREWGRSGESARAERTGLGDILPSIRALKRAKRRVEPNCHVKVGLAA